jgi:hypothetical protein
VDVAYNEAVQTKEKRVEKKKSNVRTEEIGHRWRVRYGKFSDGICRFNLREGDINLPSETITSISLSSFIKKIIDTHTHQRSSSFQQKLTGSRLGGRGGSECSGGTRQSENGIESNLHGGLGIRVMY